MYGHSLKSKQSEGHIQAGKEEYTFKPVLTIFFSGIPQILRKLIHPKLFKMPQLQK